MKRIAIFADGSWNLLERGGATNVLRMARAVRPVSAGTEQVASYDRGAGTDRKKMAGGISGVGIDRNIMDCYRFIMHNYDPGDALGGSLAHVVGLLSVQAVFSHGVPGMHCSITGASGFAVCIFRQVQ